MMRALLSRLPAVRGLPKWILVGTLFASALAGLRLWLRASREAGGGTTFGSGDDVLLALALWIPVALFLAFGSTGVRCNRLDLTLPLSARRLSAAHQIGVLLSGGTVLAFAAGVVLLHDRFAARVFAEAPDTRAGLGVPVFLAATALIFTLACLLSAWPGVYRTPTARRQGLLATTFLLGGLGLILVLNRLPLAGSLLPLAVAVALTVRGFRLLPASLTLVPLSADREEDRAGEATWTATEEPARASETRPQPPALRGVRLDASIYSTFALGIAPGQFVRIPVNLISLPFLLGMGVILSGLVFQNPVRLTNITLTTYMLMAFLAGPMAQLHILDPLPISRRRLFAMAMLPGLLAVALGYGAGRLALAVSPEKPAILFTSAATRNHAPPYRSDSPIVRVPAGQFRVAWNGEVPLNTSPWGETHDAWRMPLFAGSVAVAYSPFSTTEESSADFVALQISRAVEAVYGRTIPYEEIRERYLATTPGGEVYLRNPAGLTLLEDYPELSAGGEGPIFPVVLMLAGMLFMAVSVVYFRAFRATVSYGARLGVYFGLLGATIVLHVVPFVGFIFGFLEDWLVLGLVETGIRRLAAQLPGGAFAIWLLCGLILGAGYRWAQGAFERIEVPLPLRATAA